MVIIIMAKVAHELALIRDGHELVLVRDGHELVQDGYELALVRYEFWPVCGSQSNIQGRVPGTNSPGTLMLFVAVCDVP